MIELLRKGTVQTAIVGLLLVAARHFGWTELTEAQLTDLVNAAFFVGLVFLRRGVMKAEKAAKGG